MSRFVEKCTPSLGIEENVTNQMLLKCQELSHFERIVFRKD